MKAARTACARKEHITVPEQSFAALLAKNNAAVDFRANAETNSRREVGFNCACNHICRGALGCHNNVNTRRPRHLRKALDTAFNIFFGNHHQVGHLVDNYDDIGHGFKFERFRFIFGLTRFFIVTRHDCLGHGLAAGFIFRDFLIEARHITDIHLGHFTVAIFHFPHGPFQGHHSLFRLCHHRGEQMRAAIIDRELKHFRVNHDELTLLWRERVHQAENHGVDANRLTGTRCTRDEQMRHLGKVSNKGCAANIFTEDKRK